MSRTTISSLRQSLANSLRALRPCDARRGSTFSFVVLVALFSISGAASAQQVYYVDGSNPACSSSGPGTEAQPYCTISAALNARGGPGVIIYVKPGTYREQVTIPASGASGNPLELRALGGPVIVDAADDLSGTSNWAPYSGDVWRAASVTWQPLQVFMDGARLTPSTATPSSLPAGSFRWVSGQGLYVNAGGGNPGSHELLAGRRSYGIYASSRSWVVIAGFTVTHAQDRGIRFANSCTNMSLTDNVVNFCNRMGIQVVGGSGQLIARNVVSDNNDHGISFISGVTASTIEENESFRNINPAVRAANGIYMHGSPGNLIQRNRIHDNQDTGLHIVTGSNDCWSIQNRSWNNGDHGYDHLNASGTTDIGNVAYGNYKDGFSIEGTSPREPTCITALVSTTE